EAARSYETGRTDGFLTVPTAALAFQWSALTRYYTELRASFLPGCMVVTTAVFDQLNAEQRNALKQAAAEMVVNFNEVGQKLDDQLLGGLFEKQGMQKVTISDGFQKEFMQAAKDARGRLGAKLVPALLLSTVEGWLEEYRARGHAKK